MLFLPLFLVALIAALLQLVAHLFVERWHPRLKYIERYVIGTLCMLTPPTAAILLNGDWFSAALIWSGVGVSGVAVLIIRRYEQKSNELRDKLDELERLKRRAHDTDMAKLLEGLDHATTEQEDR